ncbi:ATP-dependent helicase [Sedimentisphaera salicampi]|uniref:DNA 3'-5' helicase n=1 Tax=Sedimentisphaera salicampi TaxID=1941349 RepID=A0A1W6LJZ0_9BACT|nr:UvrD-helicase domain-containing protein [Sedimentisphaera salicampi]ARN56066.1 ATP-dependent DNA helicase PcrA [Sedimentisphaera salicampi]
MSHSFSFDQLTQSQKEAIEHKDGPLLIIAGPGSGKTRTVTCRIARLVEKGVSPWSICAITFTNKAADEMKQRVREMGVPRGTQISTFHSLCVRILREFADYAGIKSTFSIYSDAEQKTCIKEVIKASNQSTKNFPPAKILSYISNFKNDLFDPDEAHKMADNFQQKMVAKLYKRYQNRLVQNNALDFDDLLTKTAFLIKNYPDIRKRLSERYKYILVDEYQDTNHAQYQIAKGLALEHGNICVTGDPDQSIYRWRGADIRNIMAFEKDWPNARVVKLEENFRSCPAVLNLADRLISHNRERKEKNLKAVRSEKKDIVFSPFEDQREEGLSIAGKINELIQQGHNPNEIAVLYRTNSMSRSIEEAFIREKVPYLIVRGVEFYNRKEIRDMLAYLKLISNPSDSVALERIINTPARGIGKTTMERIKSYASKKGISLWQAACEADKVELLSKTAAAKVLEFTKMIRGFQNFCGQDSFAVSDLIEDIFESSGFKAALKKSSEQEDAVENIEELINNAAFFDAAQQEEGQLGGLDDYLQMISLYSDADAYDPGSGKVSLMTLHAAKGLEFDNVFIIGLEEGILPHERSSESESQLEEERRLFFVGITRARLNLFISQTKYRTIWGREIRTMPSKFIFECGLKTEKYSAVNDRIQESMRSSRKAEREFAGKGKPSGSPAYFAGQRVSHRKFGAGVVKEYLDLGENSVITVKFDKGQIKTLIQKYAKLECLD